MKQENDQIGKESVANRTKGSRSEALISSRIGNSHVVGYKAEVL